MDLNSEGNEKPRGFLFENTRVNHVFNRVLITFITDRHSTADGESAAEKFHDQRLHLEDVLDPSPIQETDNFGDSFDEEIKDYSKQNLKLRFSDPCVT